MQKEENDCPAGGQLRTHTMRHEVWSLDIHVYGSDQPSSNLGLISWVGTLLPHMLLALLPRRNGGQKDHPKERNCRHKSNPPLFRNVAVDDEVRWHPNRIILIQ